MTLKLARRSGDRTNYQHCLYTTPETVAPKYSMGTPLRRFKQRVNDFSMSKQKETSLRKETRRHRQVLQEPPNLPIAAFC